MITCESTEVSTDVNVRKRSLLLRDVSSAINGVSLFTSDFSLLTFLDPFTFVRSPDVFVNLKLHPYCEVVLEHPGHKVLG